MSGVVIIGAGHAGVQLAASLREAGYGSDIRLLSGDPDFPYHKPPLSKSFMATKEAALQPLRGEAFFAQNNIELSLGLDVDRIDRASKTVVCADGEAIAYDKLIIATGTSARKIMTEPARGGCPRPSRSALNQPLSLESSGHLSASLNTRAAMVRRSSPNLSL